MGTGTALPEPICAPRAIDPHAEMAAIASASGLRHIHVLTWRDIAHPWAGGSELHINEVARHWARAGIEVTIRTGGVDGSDTDITRDGYRVVRAGGRISVLVSAPASTLRRRLGRHDALVEVWHGVNFMTPLWVRGPRVGIVHHVHGRQFHEVLPRGASDVAMFLERCVYPRLYRRSRLIAVSESTRRAMVDLGVPGERVSVVENGVGDQFRPGRAKSPTPLVLAVARLMPQKRVPALVEILAEVRRRNPTMEAVIVGDGPERSAVEAKVDQLGCRSWLRLAGRVDDAELLDLYSQAWVLASASAAEGWGLTITEAAACGTPSVASRIDGHEDAVIDGISGLLASSREEFVHHLDLVINNDALRSLLTTGARKRVADLEWSQTALRLLRVVAEQAASHSIRRSSV